MSGLAHLPSAQHDFHPAQRSCGSHSSPCSRYCLEEGTLKNAEFVSALWHYAPNDLVSSVLDLARWDAALTAGRLLSPSLLAHMWEPTLFSDGQRGKFGLAWSV
jgi:hypothetical protein